MTSVEHVERAAWDRRADEPTKAYAAFRTFRDLGPTRALGKVTASSSQVTVERWSSRYDWVARATAWDDAQHMAEDAERLEAIRAMHRTHQIAGRAALSIALTALRQLDPATMNAAEIARLLDLGARLERLTLSTTVEELQGLVPQGVGDDDPWDRIARELSGA